MIVCICRSVSDRVVRAARAAGAHTLSAVAAATGAGGDCGCCRTEVERILAEPCKAEPCPGCPRSRAAATVPLRAAAGEHRAP